MPTQFTPAQLQAMSNARRVQPPRTRTAQAAPGKVVHVGKVPAPAIKPLQKRATVPVKRAAPTIPPSTAVQVNLADGTSRVYKDENEAMIATQGKNLDKRRGAWFEAAQAEGKKNAAAAKAAASVPATSAPAASSTPATPASAPAVSPSSKKADKPDASKS
jgi:hypothetical protein